MLSILGENLHMQACILGPLQTRMEARSALHMQHVGSKGRTYIACFQACLPGNYVLMMEYMHTGAILSIHSLDVVPYPVLALPI